MQLWSWAGPLLPQAKTKDDRTNRLLPLNVLVMLVVVIPISVLALALVLIATATTRGVSEKLGDQIVSAAVARVSRNVETYLQDAIHVSDLYDRRVREQTLRSSN